jgi:hypothetical protein
VDNADQFLLIPAAAPHRIGKADGCCYHQRQNEQEKKVIHSIIAYSKEFFLYTPPNTYIDFVMLSSSYVLDKEFNFIVHISFYFLILIARLG